MKSPSMLAAVVFLGACGGSSRQAEEPASEQCTAGAHTLQPGATFGDLIENPDLDTDDGVCLESGGQQASIRWAREERPVITLSPDAVDAGSNMRTMCAWYGRCNAQTGDRELIDDESVLSAVDCLLETGPPGDVQLQAARDVSAHTLMAVARRVAEAGRDIEIERRPVLFWFPCQPARRAHGRVRSPEEVVRASVPPRAFRVRRCYIRGRVPRNHTGGRVVVRFVVAPDGTVQEAAITASTLGLASVEECITNEVGSWAFYPPGGEENVVVTYPFELSRPRR